LVARIAKDFPGVTAIRTREVVDLVQNIMRHIATALRITVAISLFAGLLVLTSALSATIEQRMYDVAILKVLGARRVDILKSCTAEWILLALITSIISASIGTLAAFLINARLAGREFYIMPHVTIATIMACVFVICIIGYIGNSGLFSFRPSKLLRNE
jgi:putative ABC transport system permease protein